MPASGGFGIYFQDESYNAFRQVASSANTLGNFTLIDHTPINGQRCARIHVAQAPTATINPALLETTNELFDLASSRQAARTPGDSASTSAWLRRHPQDVCLVSDGDADRLGLMGGRGEFLTTHDAIVLVLHHLARNRG